MPAFIECLLSFCDDGDQGDQGDQGDGVGGEGGWECFSVYEEVLTMNWWW